MRDAIVCLVVLVSSGVARADGPCCDASVTASASVPSGFTGDLEVGFVARQLPTSFGAGDLPGNASSRTVPGGMAGPARGSIDATGLRLRFVLGLVDGFYAGADGDALAVIAGPTVEGSYEGTPVTASPSTVLLMHAVAGWRHLQGRTLGYVELAAGGGLAGYASTCVDPSCGMRFRDTGELVGDVEARGGFEYFVRPGVVVGAVVGASVLERGAFSGGIMVGVLGGHRAAARASTLSRAAAGR